VIRRPEYYEMETLTVDRFKRFWIVIIILNSVGLITIYSILTLLFDWSPIETDLALFRAFRL
jgi:hypothetical protein